MSPRELNPKDTTHHEPYTEGTQPEPLQEADDIRHLTLTPKSNERRDCE